MPSSGCTNFRFLFFVILYFVLRPANVYVLQAQQLCDPLMVREYLA